MDSSETGKSGVQKPTTGKAPVDAAWTLPEAKTGRASAAKAAVGDKPGFAYIASLPQPQRGIAEAVDALAAETLPDLGRSVNGGRRTTASATDGASVAAALPATSSSCSSIARFSSRYPPVTPVGIGKSTRGVELKSVDDLDERRIATCMKQVASVPGAGGKSVELGIAQGSGRQDTQRYASCRVFTEME